MKQTLGCLFASQNLIMRAPQGVYGFGRLPMTSFFRGILPDSKACLPKVLLMKGIFAKDINSPLYCPQFLQLSDHSIYVIHLSTTFPR